MQQTTIDNKNIEIQQTNNAEASNLRAPLFSSAHNVETLKKSTKLSSALLIKVERADTNFGRYFVVYLRHKNKKYTAAIKKDYISHTEFLLKEKLQLFSYVDVEFCDDEVLCEGIPIFETSDAIALVKSIKTSEITGDEKTVVAAFDLETDVDEESTEFAFDVKNQILCISYCDTNGTSKVMYWAPEELEEKHKDKSFEYYKTERDLILGFLKTFKEASPDLLVAHNGYTFDLIFLWARAMFLKVPLVFGPSNKGLYWREAYSKEKITSDERLQRIWKQIVDEKTNQIKSPLIEYRYKTNLISYDDVAFVLKDFVDRENITYNMKSCHLLDTLLIAHRELFHLLETFEIQNFKLDTLSKYFFNDGKNDVDGSKVGVYWRQGGEKLRELLLYNLQDSALNLKLAQLPLFVPYYCALSQKISDYPESISFYNARANTSLYKSIIRNKAIETNLKIPDDSEEKNEYFNKALENEAFKAKVEKLKKLREEFADKMLK